MKKKVLILGAGRQGNIIATSLFETGFNIEVWDVSQDSLKKLPVGIKKKKRDFRKFKSLFSHYNLVVDCLPAFLGMEAMEAAVNNKVSCVSISYTKENPLKLNSKAKKAGVVIIPDAGLAPGLSNLLSGLGFTYLNGADTLIVKVGGIPLHPVPPINYEITWSPEDLIDEYLRVARIRRDGKLLRVPALSDIKKESIDKYKNLESFITDGLRTLLYTLPVRNMEERTIRYRGHSDIIKALKALGLFDDKLISFGEKCKISPRRFTAEIFSHLTGDSRDLVILEIVLKKSRKKMIFSLIDKGRKGVSAMTRTTGYPAFVTAWMFLDGFIEKKGIVPLEILGQNKEFAFEFLSRFEKVMDSKINIMIPVKKY